MENLYDILEISNDVSDKEIKRAYVKLLRKYPPEKNPEEFKKIRDAYERLIDPISRAEYDAFSQYKEQIEEHEKNAAEAMENEDYKRAIREYKKILIIEPTLSFAKNQLGLALTYDGQLDAAMNQFQELVRINPKNATYHSNLAYVYKAKEMYGKCEESLFKAREIDPINDNIVLDISDLYICKKEYNRAIVFLEGCLSKNKDDYFQDFIYYFEMIRAYVFENNIKMIEKIIDKIEQIMPNDEEIREYVAWKFGKLAFELYEVSAYRIAERIAKRANEINKSEATQQLYTTCKQYNLYDKLHEDNRVLDPLKGPAYYYLYGDTYEDDKAYEADYKKNIDVIESYIHSELAKDVVNSINIIRNEYKVLYDCKKELYEDAYKIALQNKNIYDQWAKLDNDSNVTNGIKRLIALWINQDLSDSDRNRYFNNIIDEIESENKDGVYNSVKRIRTYYKTLYDLNSKFLDEIEETVSNTNNYRNDSNNNTYNSTPKSTSNSNLSSSSDGGCLPIIICTILGTVIAPGIGTVIGFFIGCKMADS